MGLGNTTGNGPGNGGDGYGAGDGPFEKQPRDPTRELFERGSSEDLKKIREILYSDATYEDEILIGWRLANKLHAQSAELASDLLKLSSFPSTYSFVSELARLEHERMREGKPSLVEGDAFASLRRQVLEFGLREGRAVKNVSPHDAQSLLDATLAPISILRRTLDAELQAVVIDSIVRDTLAEHGNRCGIQMLIAQERASEKCVLSGEQMQAMAALLRDPFRPSSVLTQVGQLIDLWLAKEDSKAGPHRDLIRRQLVQDVYRHAFLGENFAANEQCLYQSIRLIRHFDDHISKGALEEAAKGSGTVPAILAALCINPKATATIEPVIWRLAGDVSLDERRAALEVLSFPVSEEQDFYLAAFMPLFFTELALKEEAGLIDPDNVYQDRLCVWEAIASRILTHGLESPLVRLISQVSDDGSPLGGEALSGVMMVLARDSKLPPVWFYDRPDRLGIFHTAARMMVGKVRDKGVSAGAQDMAQQIYSFFCIRGQQAFGCPLPDFDEPIL